MNNYGIGQSFNPHTLRTNMYIKKENQVWYDEEQKLPPYKQFRKSLQANIIPKNPGKKIQFESKNKIAEEFLIPKDLNEGR